MSGLTMMLVTADLAPPELRGDAPPEKFSAATTCNLPPAADPRSPDATAAPSATDATTTPTTETNLRIPSPSPVDNEPHVTLARIILSSNW